MNIVLEQIINSTPNANSNLLVGTVYDSTGIERFRVQIDMTDRGLAEATEACLELISRGGVPAQVLKKEIPVAVIKK